MNQASPEQRVRQQLADAAKYLPPHQAELLLRLVREIQAHPDSTQWAWALGIDDISGGNGNDTRHGH